MAIDREKYIGKFIDESLENIQKAEGLVFDIKDGISVEDDLATLQRALHTLKGTSRMLEFKNIEELSHCLENVFVSVKEQRIGISDNGMKLILASFDQLKQCLGIIQRTKNDNLDIGIFAKNLNAMAANDEYLIPQTETQNSEKEPTAARIEDVQDVKKELTVHAHENVKSESIRLSLDKIDGIIKSIASLQSLEIMSKTISLESAALNNAIKEFSHFLKMNSNYGIELIENFRKIERLGGKINSSLKNYSMDTGNHIRSAYESVISLRTLPLSTILDTYQRYVFQLSGELGKKVHLKIEGQENEIDKNIIESFSDVFMHMVRNAIDHGIETPKERINAGKDETGNLSIICSRESGNMKIVISDNGCGIDLEKIRQKAVSSGLVSETAAASLAKEELTGFIFHSGFSTSEKTTEVSGRGVGMDVVREKIESLKGSIVVDSVLGKGTTFTIMTPLSIAAIMGFPVTSGNMKFIIPANFVDTILLIKREEIITVVDRPEIKLEGRIIKIYHLSQILHIKLDGEIKDDDIIFVVIIRAYDDFLALAVDNISSMRNVILKNMPEFMKNLTVFSGIVLNENYEMVSVLHIPTIIKMAKRTKTIDLKKRNAEFQNMRKSILVVDDSLPTREIESEILSLEGYLVDTAADGAQALKAMKNKHYDLICTDINMPVMDGFMLTENIRKNEKFSHIPIIVISSRASIEDQERAKNLGASRYIIKNSFDNHNLLEAVKELIGAVHG